MSGPGAVPEVSVVIPTRNRCARLGRALASVVHQDGVAVEAIVVDDASTDATPAWLDLVATPEVQAVRLPAPSGLPQARNAGIERARGRWVAFLDDDDLWAPNKLQVQLAALAEVGASWAYGGALMVEDDLRPFTVDEPPEPGTVLERLLAGDAIPAGSSNVIVAADVLRRVGGFDESLANVADWDLWLRLAATSSAAACPDVVVACVQHRGNMHAHQHVRRYFAELDRFLAKHQDLRTSRGLTFDERPFAQWVAEGRARAGHRSSAAVIHLRDGLRHRDPTSARRAARSLLGAQPLLRSRRNLPTPAWLAAYGPRGL